MAPEISWNRFNLAELRPLLWSWEQSSWLWLGGLASQRILRVKRPAFNTFNIKYIQISFYTFQYFSTTVNRLHWYLDIDIVSIYSPCLTTSQNHTHNPWGVLILRMLKHLPSTASGLTTPTGKGALAPGTRPVKLKISAQGKRGCDWTGWS